MRLVVDVLVGSAIWVGGGLLLLVMLANAHAAGDTRQYVATATADSCPHATVKLDIEKTEALAVAALASPNVSVMTTCTENRKDDKPDGTWTVRFVFEPK